MRRSLRRAGRVVAVMLPLALAACQTLIKPSAPCGDGGDGCPHTVCDPKVLHKPTVHAAACDLDHLEKHIDWHGSVTAKVPDVWGQARLTLYREQFEQQMEFELNRFDVSLQGSLARQDQAFLLNATALNASLETPLRPYRTQVIPAGRYLRGGLTNGLPANPQDKTNIVVLDKDQTVLVPPTQPPATPPTNTGFPAISLDSSSYFADGRGLAFRSQFLGRSGEKLNLSLEPERYLEQKKRYLDLLAQIRRANEGDDTADAPGYSLQLFRIPVSVLPGKHTDQGHGAEITMTLTPILGDDLLPTTFRGLVINDLVYQLGFPITQALNPGENEAFKQLVTPEVRVIVETITLVNDYLDAVPQDVASAQLVVRRLTADQLTALLKALADPNDQKTILALAGQTPATGVKRLASTANLKVADVARAAQVSPPAAPAGQPTTFSGTLSSVLAIPPLSFATGTDSRTALPTSQLVDVYGTAYSFEIALGARQAFEKTIRRQKYAHLPDVQAYLKEELNAAYELLSNPRNQALWDFCTPDLVHLIRTQAYDQLDKRRRQFRQTFAGLALSGPANTDRPDAAQLSRTAAFAWGIIVDAALLTDKTCKDMKAAATARSATIPGAAEWLPLYLPCPPAEARTTFNQYVRVRWPIHVFALDPAVQEQNLADRLSTRRELQLALSLAFSHGFMSFNQLTRYARRLEAEYETIDLNRTQVGFAHGADTFGWRFYPRYQTPDTPGNLTVVARDLIAGGPNRNQLLRQRRLEPGPRECVALVIMPSFVPAVTLDTTSNFFGLANPKHKVFDHTQAVKLGRTVQAIKTAGLTDANCYRHGDAERLIKRAEQLEARLPLQTATFQVPTEGTLGGFELFNTTTTSLSPELFGFYGAPGISTAATANHLFLVGDHFSPLRTRVIVGNQGLVKNDMVPRASTAPVAPAAVAPATAAPAPATTEVKKMVLLSRQVMQVEIPPGLLPLQDTGSDGKTRYYYTVHVATPYGVSRELLVPAVCPVDPCKAPAPDAKPAASEGYKLGADTLTLPYCKKGAGKGEFALNIPQPFPDDLVLKLNWGDALGVAPRQIKDVTFLLEYKNCPITLVVPGPIDAKGGSYTIGSAQLQKLLDDLLVKLNGFGPFSEENNPLTAGFKVKEVKVTPVEVDPRDPKTALRAVVITPVAGDLTLTFKCSICDNKALVPGTLPVPMPAPEPVPPKKGKGKGKGDDESVGTPVPVPAPIPVLPALAPAPIPVTALPEVSPARPR